MHVGVIGTGERAKPRRAALAGLPPPFVVEHRVPPADPLDDEGLEATLTGLDVAFIAVAPAEVMRVATAAARQGLHFFLEWPPAASLREGERLLKLSEEAGVEVGVSRPWRFHPALAARPAGWKATLAGLTTFFAGEGPAPLVDAVDLAVTLARSGTVQRVDAEAVRTGARLDAVAFTLRFHNGAFAQGMVRRGPGPPALHVFAAGAGHTLEADLAAPPENAGRAAALEPLPAPALLQAESRAFLDALARRQPPPVSLLDGLHTLRLLERLMARLR